MKKPWPLLPVAVTLAALLLCGCGVKNDLTKPDGTRTPQNTPDPSLPPYPIGR